MAPTETTIYNETYAARYLDSIRTPYSQLKYTRLAHLTKALNKISPVVLDIGGNINGTVIGGLRSKMEAEDPTVQYIVLDVSPSYFNGEFLRSVQPSVHLYPEVHGIVGNAHDMEIPTASMDIVVLADVLEHLDQPTLALQEASRVMKNDGTLFLVLPALYKLDLLKDKHPIIRRMVDEKRSTSHVNFYGMHSAKNQLVKAGFSEPYIEGLGFLTGFPYLLWTNPLYIPDERNHLDTREAGVFKAIKLLLSALDVNIHFQLDEIMNSERGRDFLQRMVHDTTRHPLEVIYDVLALHPAYQKGEQVFVSTYQRLRELVESEKPNFDAEELRTMLAQVMETNPYQFLANSVIFCAGK